MADFRFELNRAGIGSLLKNEGGDYVEQIARQRASGGLVVTRQAGATRANVRIADPSGDALDNEAKTGHLSRLLGGA